MQEREGEDRRKKNRRNRAQLAFALNYKHGPWNVTCDFCWFQSGCEYFDIFGPVTMDETETGHVPCRHWTDVSGLLAPQPALYLVHVDKPPATGPAEQTTATRYFSCFFWALSSDLPLASAHVEQTTRQNYSVGNVGESRLQK